MTAILTANTQFAVKQTGGYRNFIAAVCLQKWNALPNWTVSGNPIMAWVCRSAWVVLCECGEQDFIEPGEPFFCPNCLNGRNKGFARPVVWPQTGDRRKIEWLLTQRAIPDTRNWLPHETISDLETEQRQHGEL